MRITNLEIANFKGIKNAFITFPKDSRVVCLIGAGDSTKSTILQAIEWILWPSWNLPASDSDFFECDNCWTGYNDYTLSHCCCRVHN